MVLGDPTFSKPVTNYTLWLEKISNLLRIYANELHLYKIKHIQQKKNVLEKWRL